MQMTWAQLIRKTALGVAGLAVAANGGAASAQTFQLITDPGATYVVEKRIPKSDALVEIITKRTKTNRSGEAEVMFTRRLLDCERRSYRVMNSGETLKAAEAKDPGALPIVEDEEGAGFEPIFAGAISEAVWKAGCNR